MCFLIEPSPNISSNTSPQYEDLLQCEEQLLSSQVPLLTLRHRLLQEDYTGIALQPPTSMETVSNSGLDEDPSAVGSRLEALLQYMLELWGGRIVLVSNVPVQS
jgi:hypothetical protein